MELKFTVEVTVIVPRLLSEIVMQGLDVVEEDVPVSVVPLVVVEDDVPVSVVPLVVDWLLTTIVPNRVRVSVALLKSLPKYAVIV